MTHDMNYLRLLAEKFPTIESVTNELVNLRAIMHLPKGTEYYFSDLHGEHEAFIHLLRSGSGVIREKIDALFRSSMMEEDRSALAALVYYPTTQMARARKTEQNYADWCTITINHLVIVACEVSAKYTRSKVRQTIDPRYAGLIEELMNTDGTDVDKRVYYREMIETVVQVGCAEGLIKALCHLIQQMTVDQLHIIGDIFDRGPRADRILDELMKHHDVDIQWGNHDVTWIGAMCGNPVCLMSVLRIAISYNGFDCLEDGYGINLRPLSMFAATTYANDPCERFMPHVLDENEFDPVDPALAAKMHKAVTVMMFKLEGQLIRRHPEYEMEGRLLLDKMNLEKGTIQIGGKEYQLTDTNFPTVDPKDPYALTEEEQNLLDGFQASFRHSERLRTHLDFIMSHGAMYKIANNKLLYHGCILVEEDGSLTEVELGGGCHVEFPVIAVARDDRQPDGKIPVSVFGVESHFDDSFVARLYRLAAECGLRTAALGMHVEQRHLLVCDVRVFEAQLYRSVRFGYLSQILHRLFKAQQARIGGRSHLRSQYCRDESHRLEDAHGFPVF